MPLNDKSLSSRIVRVSKGFFRIATTNGISNGVNSGLLVDELFSFRGLLPCRYRSQFIDFQRDQSQRVLSNVRRFGDHDRDGLANIPHFVDGDRQLKKLFISWKRCNARANRRQVALKVSLA